MEITEEEGLLHLNQWCSEETPLMVQHFTRNLTNSTMIMGEIVVIEDGEIFISIDEVPKKFLGHHRYEDATWIYTETGDLPALPESLGVKYHPQTPVLCFGWPESEMLLFQPRPPKWDEK